MAFASDMSYLYVAIKGRLPTDLNNPTGMMQPGYIASYAITDNMTLAAQATETTAAAPFSIVEDFNAQGVYFLSDVTTGYSTFRPGPNELAVQGTIPNQAAVS